MKVNQSRTKPKRSRAHGPRAKSGSVHKFSQATGTVRINHPKRRKIIDCAIRTLRASKNHEKHFMFPDLFFHWIFITEGARGWFSKQNLYEAIEGRVRRPKANSVYFHTRKQLLRKPTRSNHAVSVLAEKLEREGTVFLKPTGPFAGEAAGIARIQQKKGTLTITLTEESRVRSLAATLGQISFRVEGNRTITIPLNRTQSIRNVLRIITSSQFEQRNTFEQRNIVESEIRIPLYKGRKWEIRTVVQSPNREPEVVGHQAKLGATNTIIANVGRGGKGAESSQIVTELYKVAYPKKSEAEIGALTTEFFRKANVEAEKSISALNKLIQGLGERYLSGFPKSELYAREAAVDISGEFNPRTGKMDPVVIEVQYPFFGGQEDFRTFDPLGYSRYKKNRKKMAQEGKNTLMRAFGLT